MSNPLNIIFAIDVSGSMQGEKIASINAYMNEIIFSWNDIKTKFNKEEILTSVLLYADSCHYLLKNSSNFEDFVWKEIYAGGCTNFGQAVNTINRQILASNKKLDKNCELVRPIIIFISDGNVNDDLFRANKNALNNIMFKKAIKICVSVGDYADIDLLETIATNINTVIKINDIESLVRLLEKKVLSSEDALLLNQNDDNLDEGNEDSSKDDFFSSDWE